MKRISPFFSSAIIFTLSLAAISDASAWLSRTQSFEFKLGGQNLKFEVEHSGIAHSYLTLPGKTRGKLQEGIADLFQDPDTKSIYQVSRYGVHIWNGERFQKLHTLSKAMIWGNPKLVKGSTTTYTLVDPAMMNFAGFLVYRQGEWWPHVFAGLVSGRPHSIVWVGENELKASFTTENGEETGHFNLVTGEYSVTLRLPLR